MSKEKFSEGKWFTKAGSNCGDGLLLVRDGARQSHLQVNPAADAHLMSAAKDMYRALLDVADAIPVHPNEFGGQYNISLTQSDVEAIRTALAKADGQNGD